MKSLFLIVFVIAALVFNSIALIPAITSRIVKRSALRPLLAASGRGGGGGSTKLDNKVKQDTATKPTYMDEIEKDWRLILHDDSVHTIQQVCEILGSVSIRENEFQ